MIETVRVPKFLANIHQLMIDLRIFGDYFKTVIYTNNKVVNN